MTQFIATIVIGIAVFLLGIAAAFFIAALIMGDKRGKASMQAPKAPTLKPMVGIENKESQKLGAYLPFNEANFEKAKLKARLAGHSQFMYHGEYHNCRYGGK